jgi:hypothetical protein
MATNF